MEGDAKYKEKLILYFGETNQLYRIGMRKEKIILEILK